MKGVKLLLVSVLLLCGSVSVGATGDDHTITSWVDWESIDPPPFHDVRELQEWVLSVTAESAPPTPHRLPRAEVDYGAYVVGGLSELVSLGSKYHDENGCSIPGILGPLTGNIFLTNWVGHPVCNGHDNCYHHASNFDWFQSTCDIELRNTLGQWCFVNYEVFCGSDIECLETCLEASETVYQGLVSFGSAAYNNGKNDNTGDCQWGRQNGRRDHDDGYCCDSDVNGPSGSGPSSCFSGNVCNSQQAQSAEDQCYTNERVCCFLSNTGDPFCMCSEPYGSCSFPAFSTGQMTCGFGDRPPPTGGCGGTEIDEEIPGEEEEEECGGSGGSGSGGDDDVHCTHCSCTSPTWSFEGTVCGSTAAELVDACWNSC